MNKYQREIKQDVNVDVYDVLKAFNVTCPAMAHAIKKCLAPGQRGVKTSIQDKKEAIASIERSIEMESTLKQLIDDGELSKPCFHRGHFTEYDNGAKVCNDCDAIVNIASSPARSTLSKVVDHSI